MREQTLKRVGWDITVVEADDSVIVISQRCDHDEGDTIIILKDEVGALCGILKDMAEQ